MSGAMSQLIRPCLVIALYALLLPVFGPLLDHHFVEWQHNHAHVYSGGAEAVTGAHRHVYDLDYAVGRGHAHPLPAPDSPSPALPEGVAFLSDYDGAGGGSIYAPTGPAPASLCFPNPGDGPLLTSFAAHRPPPDGALTAPPRKPPPA